MLFIECGQIDVLDIAGSCQRCALATRFDICAAKVGNDINTGSRCNGVCVADFQ